LSGAGVLHFVQDDTTKNKDRGKGKDRDKGKGKDRDKSKDKVKNPAQPKEG
jgi:hypothetical protein